VSSAQASDAPAVEEPGRRQSPWPWLVAISAVVLVVAGAAMASLRYASERTRTTSYALSAVLLRVEIDVDRGTVQVVGGGGGTIEVQRTQRYTFGHPPKDLHSEREGVLRIVARCPQSVLGACSSDYRVTVPDGLPIRVNVGSGQVHVASFRGVADLEAGTGDINADAFCGSSLTGTTGTGDIRIAASCSPMNISLVAGHGNITAVVPPGRYHVDAHTQNGTTSVRGVIQDVSSPFAINAASANGDVTVEASP
jgi:hypothetical protein